MGSSNVLELYGDGRGGWTDADGNVLRELDGTIDMDLGITPVPLALAVRRLASAAEATARCARVRLS